MSYQNTTNLQLKKDNSDEQIVNWRTHNNDNLDTLDQLIHYILLSIASIENGNQASTGYDVDEYMLYKGRLCRTMQSITSGTSLQIGINIEYVTISDTFVFLQNALNNISADQITSGTFSTSCIPSLPASKITSGTLPVAYGGSGQSAPTVDNVKNNIVKSTGTNCSVTGYSVVKWGKIVQLYLAITVSTAKNTGDVLATVQTDYVPLMTTPLMNLANLAKGCSVQESSGEIKARAAFTANETMYIVGTYLIA